MKKNHLFELLRLVQWPKKIIIISLTISIITSFVNLALPLLTKNVIDEFSMNHINLTNVLLLISIFIVNSILGGVSYYMLKYIGSNAIYYIRKEMWQHILRLPISYFDNHESGQIMSRLTDDIETMNHFVSEKIPNLLSQIIIVLGSIIMLFILDWKLTLAMISIIPVTLLVILPIGNLTYKISTKLQDEMAEFTGVLSRVLTEIRLVKSYSAENKEYRNGERKLYDLFQLNLKEAKIQAIVSPIVTGVMMIMLLVIIGYGGLRVSNGVTSAGSFVAIIFYLIQSFGPIIAISSFYTDYKKTSGSTERLYNIYQIPIENHELSNTNSDVLVINSDLVIKDLTFSYDQENDILVDINFKVPKNKTTAIVGPSGSGKSTLFYLIERMYEPTGGNIYYNDIPISEYNLTDWRRTIGYVMQDSSMMNGTVAENISYGIDWDYNMEDIVNSAKLANAHQFIMDFPDQYDSIVGERGVKLSGGQKQRIAIGRAFMRNPKVLLLDEATSSLDSESEKLVQEALDKLTNNRTTIVIAHRLSTIKNADQIIFLDKGRVTGIGTHQELYASHRKYALFVDTQAFEEKKQEKGII